MKHCSEHEIAVQTTLNRFRISRYDICKILLTSPAKPAKKVRFLDKLLRLTCEMEFILGNDKLSFITMSKRYMLRIELEDFLGEKRYAMYSTLSVRPSKDKYRLIVGGYSGDAGKLSLCYTTNRIRPNRSI